MVSYRFWFVSFGIGGINRIILFGEWRVKENIGIVFVGGKKFVIFFNVVIKYSK